MPIKSQNLIGNNRLFVVAALIALAFTTTCMADLRMPRIFTDHMVLQRNADVPVWGWAKPGDLITVSFSNQVVTTTADASGNWKLKLNPLDTSANPATLTISTKSNASKQERVIKDVLVGEVWLCSGQSNMEWGIKRSKNWEDAVAEANNPNIRLFAVPKTVASAPREDLPSACAWNICTSKNLLSGGSQEKSGFSAVAYHFGRELQHELNIPIGLIQSAWGGTRIEPWTPPVGFRDTPALASIHNKVEISNPASDNYKKELTRHLSLVDTWSEQTKLNMTHNRAAKPMPKFPSNLMGPTNRQNPTALYNGMISGMVPFAIRGAIWYQGESNRTDGMLYYEKMKALIYGWRSVWDQPELPFYYVQIAPFSYGKTTPTELPLLWEAQTRAQEIPNTGMAVIYDYGSTTNIHPSNKAIVGQRLSHIALAKNYGREDIPISGPQFNSMTIEDNRIRIAFNYAESGLDSRDGKPLTHFEIGGEGTQYFNADAIIDGNNILVSSTNVPTPSAVRFMWHKIAEPNLINKDGLPAISFRAGKLSPPNMLKSIDDAKDYTLIYDLDLNNISTTIDYSTNNSKDLTNTFDRIAYLLELQKPNSKLQYLYVSLDAFSDDPTKIGIPSIASKAQIQCLASNLVVETNVKSLDAINIAPAGSIEFWPNNYKPENSAGIPGASDELFDHGDKLDGGTVNGYGSMQVHLLSPAKTLFSINHWKEGSKADIGIGSSTGKTRDWTFSNNADQYIYKRLRVLVHQNNAQD